MTEPEPVDEDEPTPAALPTPPAAIARTGGGRPPGLTLAVALAAVFAVTTVLLAVVAVGLKSDRDDAEADQSAGTAAQQALVAAASTFTEAFVDRDATVESLRDDVLALSTDEFGTEFSRGVDQVMAVSEPLGLVSSVATVQEVYATTADGATASAIVLYSSVTSFVDSTDVNNQGQYMYLELVKDGDRWLVNNVADLVRVISEAAGATSGAGG